MTSAFSARSAVVRLPGPCPNTPGTNWRVQVLAMSADVQAPPVSAQSAGPFSIVALPTIGSLIPNGGEAWQLGTHHNITWTSANSVTDSIVFTRDGSSWIYVGKRTPPTNTFDWNVPGPASTTCKVRVFALGRDILAPKVSVTSATDFSIIAAPTVGVTAPNGGETWLAGSTQNITWTSANSNTDSIVWSADNAATWSFVGKQTTPITHSFAWLVPSTHGSQNLVKVFAIGPATTASDQSNGTFTILSPTAVWSSQTELPLGDKSKNIKDGGALTYGKEGTDANDTGYVYAFKGNNTYEFYRFNTSSNAWISRDSIPAVNRNTKKKGVKKGSTLVMATDGKIYAAKGNNTLDWWQYSPSARTWTQKTDVPVGAKNLKEGVGSAAVKIGSDNYVYLLRGSGTYDFYRYNTATDVWDITLPTAPGGASTKAYKNGSSITYDGNDTIYCLKGSYNEFAAYSVSGKTWVTKDPLPLVAPPGTKKTKVKDGSQIAYAGSVVYALKGGNTNEFWMYKTDEHKWSTATELTVGSKKVKGGGALVVAKDVSALFAFRGNNTLEFWQYGPIGTFSYMPGPGNELKAVQGGSSFIVHRSSLSVTPNPFTTATAINYTLPRSGDVSLKLHDITGKLVSTLAGGYHPAGSYSTGLSVVGGKLSAGVYLLKFETEGYNATEKLIIE